MADWFDDEETDEKYDPEQREREEAERLRLLEEERRREEEERQRKLEEEKFKREEERLRRERELLEKEEYNRKLRRKARVSDFFENARRVLVISLIVLLIGAVLFGIVYGIIAAIRGIGNSIADRRARREYERYSIDNIVISEVVKEAQSEKISYVIKNNSTYDIERVYGDMVIYDIYGDEVASVKGLYYSGTIESGKSLSTYYNFKEYENEYYLYPLSELTIRYNIKEIDYENGETRTYEDGLKELHRVTLESCDKPEYSLDNIEYKILSKDSYSTSFKIELKNNSGIDVKVYRLNIKFYDENGKVVGEFGRIFWGTMRAGTSEKHDISPSDGYTDPFYYGTLADFKVTVAFRSITYADGVSVIYPEEEATVNDPFSENNT